MTTQITAPTPIQMASVPGAPVRPYATSAVPTAIAVAPSTSRRRMPFSWTTRSSRIAATGATFAARHAGTKPATMVTTTPTTKPASTIPEVRVRTSPETSRPKRVRNARATRRATPSPTSSPVALPTTPITKASMSTERVTCPLLAPSARRRADSRTRCDTRIEKVLKMMKAPTTIAITANVTRK